MSPLAIHKYLSQVRQQNGPDEEFVKAFKMRTKEKIARGKIFQFELISKCKNLKIGGSRRFWQTKR